MWKFRIKKQKRHYRENLKARIKENWRRDFSSAIPLTQLLSVILAPLFVTLITLGIMTLVDKVFWTEFFLQWKAYDRVKEAFEAKEDKEDSSPEKEIVVVVFDQRAQRAMGKDRETVHDVLCVAERIMRAEPAVLAIDYLLSFDPPDRLAESTLSQGGPKSSLERREHNLNTLPELRDRRNCFGYPQATAPSIPNMLYYRERIYENRMRDIQALQAKGFETDNISPHRTALVLSAYTHNFDGLNNIQIRLPEIIKYEHKDLKDYIAPEYPHMFDRGNVPIDVEKER